MHGDTPDRAAPLTEIIFAGFREPAYVRNAVVLRSLAMRGLKVSVLSSQARTYPIRIVQTISNIMWTLLRRKRADFFFAGFLGQPVALIFNVFRKKPLVLDSFVSVFDTLCTDRRVVAPGGLLGRLLRALDVRACMVADLVLVDTDAQARFLASTFGVNAGKIRVLPVGADEELFRPSSSGAAGKTVFYYSSGLPLHGLSIVVEAARLLEGTEVLFRIAGLKPEPSQPKNLTALGWLSEREIAAEVQLAAICLGGHFAVNEKARRVVPGKAYQFAAAGKPLLLTFGAGNEELFTPARDAIFCEPGSPAELARTIEDAMNRPEMMARIGREGRSTFERAAGADVIATQLKGFLGELRETSFRSERGHV